MGVDLIPSRGVLKTSVRWPPTAAYGALAAIVFVGRELDLMHELFLGSGVAANENLLAEFAAQTITNTVVGVVWPSFLYASLDHIWFAGVMAGYLVIVLLLYLADRPNSSNHRPPRSSRIA